MDCRIDMSRRSTDMEKEHEINESLKGHKIVQTCNHVQELGIKPTKHNQDAVSYTHLTLPTILLV